MYISLLVGAGDRESSQEDEDPMAKLEKQIKELQEKIEKTYASDLQDLAKEDIVKGWRQQLDALMNQKSALQQAKIKNQVAQLGSAGRSTQGT